MGRTWVTAMRCPAVATNPPVPMRAPEAYFRMPASSASAVASITLLSDTCAAAILSVWTWTCGIFSRSPQMATLATPGTRSNRSRIVQ